MGVARVRKATLALQQLPCLDGILALRLEPGLYPILAKSLSISWFLTSEEMTIFMADLEDKQE